MLTWLALERVLKGKSTSVGASVGAVAGRESYAILNLELNLSRLALHADCSTDLNYLVLAGSSPLDFESF